MNYSYELSRLNRDQLGWFVALVTGHSIEQVREWLRELEEDEPLREHIQARLATNPRRGIYEREVHWARRLGWYALARAMQPEHVVETGTDLGLGSCVIAAALLRNGRGRLTTIDTDPGSGYLIAEPWGTVITRRIGSSLDILPDMSKIEMFIHDSLHTYEHESAELAIVEQILSPGALVLSDNAHASPALTEFAQRTQRRYLFFKEEPVNHWWPGDGIGVAW